MALQTACVAIVVVLLFMGLDTAAAAAAEFSAWQTGRSSFYGEHDSTHDSTHSTHYSSCRTGGPRQPQSARVCITAPMLRDGTLRSWHVIRHSLNAMRCNNVQCHFLGSSCSQLSGCSATSNCPCQEGIAASHGLNSSPPITHLPISIPVSFALAGTDAWSIHKGSCGYNWLDRSVATGELSLLLPVDIEVCLQPTVSRQNCVLALLYG